MKFKLDTQQIVYFMFTVIVIVFDFKLFYGNRLFLPILVVSLFFPFIRYISDFFAEGKRQVLLEKIFPEFVRDLIGVIKSGMTVPNAITHLSDTTDYAELSPYLKKMSNQLSWSIPVHKVLMTFANDTKNKIIKRAIRTVIEAEQSGGNIEEVLESITTSLVDIKRIKEERKAGIHSQVIQSYIIFIVFLGVMVVISNMLIPFMTNVGSDDESFAPTMTQQALTGMMSDVKIDTRDPVVFVKSLGQWFLSIDGVFLMLSLIQGFFAGVVIGKLSEGTLEAGLKHSLILGGLAFFIITLT